MQNRVKTVLWGQIPLWALTAWAFVEQGPLPGLALILLNAIGSTALLLFRGLSEDVVQELRKLWAPQIARWIAAQPAELHAAWRRRTDGFARRYYEWWGFERDRINTYGLTSIREAPRIRDIFVGLRIAPGSREKLSRQLITPTLEDSQSIWHFLRLNMYRKNPGDNRAWVVLGGAGYGKTTLMQHVATALTNREYRRYKARAYVPVLLYLREHIDTITTEEPPQLGQLLHDYFSNPRNEERRINPPPGWFEAQLKRGRCVVLFDGLDEVAVEEQRKRVSAWIDKQIGAYRQSLFVVTSRPGGYKDAPLEHPRISELQMQSFDAKQRKEFLEKWYTAEKMRGNRSRRAKREARMSAVKKTRQVLADLRTKPALLELSGNPLLLTMIAVAALDEGSLPDSRVELYDEFYYVLVHRRALRKEIRDPITKETKESILYALAAWMMTEEQVEVSDTTARDLIAPLVVNLKLLQDDPRYDVLNAVHTTTNLITPVGGDLWIFAHASFREYIAARMLHEGKIPVDWYTFIEMPWWSETLRFYAEIGDVTPIVQVALERDTAKALALAAECKEISKTIDPNIARQFDAVIAEDLEAEPKDRRQLAAEVLLAQRLSPLRKWKPVSEDTENELDPTYITCAEYQRFLDEQYEQGEHYQPHHWQSYRFPQGNAREPVTGVLPKDADAFTQWLNTRETGRWRYRLPAADEYQSEKNRQSYLSFWCQNKTITPLSAQEEDFVTTLLAAQGRTQIQPPRSFSDISYHDSDSDSDNDSAHDISNSSVLLPLYGLARNIFLIGARIVVRVIAIVPDRHIVFFLDSIPSFACARVLSRILALDLTSALALPRDLASTNATNRVRDLAHVFDLASTIARTRELTSVLFRIFARASTHDLDRTSKLARDLANACDLACDRDQTKARISDFARALVRDSDIDIGDFVFTNDNDRDQAEARVLVRVLVRILVRARTSACDLAHHYRGIDKNFIDHLERASQMAKELKNRLDTGEEVSETRWQNLAYMLQPLVEQAATVAIEELRTIVNKEVEGNDLPEQRRHSLMKDLLDVLEAQNDVDAMRAWRRYVAHLAEYAYFGAEEEKQASKRRPFWKFWRRTVSPEDFDEVKEFASRVYWWVRVVELREAGELPAWEGIRLVREPRE